MIIELERTENYIKVISSIVSITLQTKRYSSLISKISTPHSTLLGEMVVLVESFPKARLNVKCSWRKDLYCEIQPDTGRDQVPITLLNESAVLLNSLWVKQQNKPAADKTITNFKPASDTRCPLIATAVMWLYKQPHCFTSRPSQGKSTRSNDRKEPRGHVPKHC